MPKHEIYHPVGQKVPIELKELLFKFFKDKDVEKLEKFGGRVQILLTTPYYPKKKIKKSMIEIGKPLIIELHKNRNNPKKLRDTFGLLSVIQLRSLGKLINHPLRTKSPRNELIEELVSHFHSEEVWNRIAQIHKKE